MTLNNRSVFSTALVAMALLIGGSLSVPSSALAHAGHAGKKIEFMAEKDAFRQMLPKGAKITKRKERLTDANAQKAEDKWGVDLDRDIYTYFLARDRNSKEVIGTAMASDLFYRHGKVGLALGMDKDGLITKAAVLNVHSKYLPDLKRSIGTGFLPALTGKSIDDLGAMLAKVEKDDWGAKEVLAQFRNMMAIVLQFQQ